MVQRDGRDAHKYQQAETGREINRHVQKRHMTLYIHRAGKDLFAEQICASLSFFFFLIG